jgi:hypothetical protein
MRVITVALSFFMAGQALLGRAILLAIAVPVIMGAAQENASRTTASMGCPGGRISTELELAATPLSLDHLIRMSDLIVRGRVVGSAPAFSRNPNDATAIETDSIISVTATLRGTPPSGNSTITLAQEGGKTAQCEEVVPNDPLVQEGEEYVLFLREDDRKQPVPNNTGSTRYFAAGIWSGKAKIENQKISFLKEASPGLHKFDGMDATAFVSTLTERAKLILPSEK